MAEKITKAKEWWISKAQREGTEEVGAGLDLETLKLAEYLMGLSSQIRYLSKDENYMEIGAMLEEVRGAADNTVGDRCLLLKVAESFLRTILGSDFTAADKALWQFATTHKSEGLKCLSEMCIVGMGLYDFRLSPKMQEDIETLIKIGACRRLAGQRVDVTPSKRPFVRNLIESRTV